MNTARERFSTKVRKALETAGLSGFVISQLDSYLSGTLREKAYLKKVPSFNSGKLSYDVAQQFHGVLHELRPLMREEWASRVVHLFSALLGKDIVTLFDRYRYLYRGAELGSMLFEYGIEAELIAAGYAEVLAASTLFSPESYEPLDRIYREKRKALQKGVSLCSVNARILLKAYLAGRNPVFHATERKTTDASLAATLVQMFREAGVGNAETASVLAFVKEGRSCDPEDFRNVRACIPDNNGWNTLILFLTGIIQLVLPVSQLSRRLLRVLAMLKHTLVLRSLFVWGALSDTPEDAKKFLSSVDLGEEYYLSWIADTLAPQTEAIFSSLYSLKQRAHRKEAAGVLREYLEQVVAGDPELAGRAVRISAPLTAMYLASFLWKSGKGADLIPELEHHYLDGFRAFFEKLGVEARFTALYAEYVSGDKPFSAVQGGIRGALVNQTYYVHGHEHLKMIPLLGGGSELPARTIRLYAASGVSNLLNACADAYAGSTEAQDKMADFVKFMKTSGVPEGEVIGFLAGRLAEKTSLRNELDASADRLIRALAVQERDTAVTLLASLPSEQRACLLRILFEADREANFQVILEYLSDKAKTVRDVVVDLLSGVPAVSDLMIPCLSARKREEREVAVRVLAQRKDSRVEEALTQALDSEKSEAVRKLIREALNISSSAGAKSDGGFDLPALIRKTVSAQRVKSLAWLNPDTLPELRWKENNQPVDEEYLLFLLLSASSPSGSDADIASATGNLREDDLAGLAYEVLSRFLAAGAEAKRKWAILFSAQFGDLRVLDVRKKQIDIWAKNSRSAIAGDTVMALARNGSREYLMVVDGFAQKHKVRKVKETASRAMKEAAEILGITAEELSDRIVPNLGFSKRGEKVIDYGARTFTVRLNHDFSLEILDEAGKKLKNPPAPGKKDDPEKAEAARSEFRQGKKLLKTLVGTQTKRLEAALSLSRDWSRGAWEALFVENPIMHLFATGLIWGTYRDGELLSTFRYMDDGSFNTVDEEEFTPEDEAVIGLIHPIELEPGLLSSWRDQLADYEVTQPFVQIDRPVYEHNEEERTGESVDRFGGTVINGLSLLGKLTSFGWYRGSVQDGGMYSSFYTESSYLGIGAELAINGLPVGMENEEVILFQLTFYRAGSVNRGSYVYDSITAEKLIPPHEVPKRYFSEILYQVDTALASKSGTREDWKAESLLSTRR